ncbi:MAG: hypothetical protein M1821_004015 [Bathelium mastoideum]|nr:MAG: hypothetical protein M1821_004015 [Bathelium mastoideum]KAI9691087.1 MAG: hypothetical protein M1822_008707 [Bathelium mastoideum]
MAGKQRVTQSSVLRIFQVLEAPRLSKTALTRVESAEEPRRSGRATKGQHTKNQEAAETPPKSKGKKGKSKAAKQASHEPTPDEDGEEDNSVIRCLCGAEEDEGGYRMICCDGCEVWQHNICMGLPEEEHLQPDSYFCEQCRPQNHKELLAAIARGEKPWEDRMRQHEEQEKKAKRNRGKKGKGGSKQAKTNNSAPEAVQEAPPAAVPPITETPEDTKKRKFSELENSHPKVDDAPERSVRRQSESTKDSRRRSSAVKAESPTVPQHNRLDLQTQLVQEVEQLPKERRGVGDALLKVIADLIRQVSRQGHYRIPDGQTADSLGNHHALLIEYSLFMNHCGTSSAPTQAYKNQFREINANLKRNPTLLSRLLQGSLTPDELSTMSSTDMATEERQKELAAIKEQNEKQATLVEEQKPRMRKTHKGDELIEDERQGDSTFAPPPPARRNTEDVAMANASDNQFSPTIPEQPGRNSQRPTSVDTSSTAQQRRDSSTFNINNVWSSVQSPTEQSRPLSQPSRRRSSGAPKQQANGTSQETRPSVDDPEIDRLLRDEPDDEAYSPADTSGPMGLWRGDVYMNSIARFPVVATHVAGAELSDFHSYASLLPPLLEIDGRLAKDVADKYLCGLQHSKTSDVSVLNLGLASHDPALKAEFGKLFEYFHERGRYAVVGKPGHEVVRDIYISPVEAGMGPLPRHIDLLEVNNIERPLPDRLLLITIVVKRYEAGLNQTPSAHRPDEASPVNAGPGTTPQAVSGAPQPVTASNGPSPIYGSPLPTTGQQSSIPTHAHPAPSTQQPYQSVAPGQERAFRILGPELFQAPVVANLLAVTPEISEEQLANLKDLLEKNPETRESIEALSMVLKAKNEAEGQQVVA